MTIMPTRFTAQASPVFTHRPRFSGSEAPTDKTPSKVSLQEQDFGTGIPGIGLQILERLEERYQTNAFLKQHGNLLDKALTQLSKSTTSWLIQMELNKKNDRQVSKTKVNQILEQLRNDGLVNFWAWGMVPPFQLMTRITPKGQEALLQARKSGTEA